jgi:hypothetical protein
LEEDVEGASFVLVAVEEDEELELFLQEKKRGKEER